MRRQFSSAEDFRRSLETRLQRRANGVSSQLVRLRRRVAFERLLARLSKDPDTSWVLKGGFAMELRYRASRATKDIDLVLAQEDIVTTSLDTSTLVHTALRNAAAIDLQDHFQFVVETVNRELQGPIYGGARCPVLARVGSREFIRFPVDIALAEPALRPLDIIEPNELLGDFGIETSRISVITREQQFAEKLHAYSIPHGDRPNTRVKDLIDMILLIQESTLDPTKIRNAIANVFSRRNEHEIPSRIAPPPEDWRDRFQQLAEECELEISLSQAHTLVSTFYAGLSS